MYTRLSDIIMRNTEMYMDHSAFLSPNTTPVGGILLPIDATLLLLANMQTNLYWLVPVVVSVLGLGLVLSRKHF